MHREKDLRKNSTKSEFNCHLPLKSPLSLTCIPGWTGPSPIAPHDPGPLSVRAQSGTWSFPSSTPSLLSRDPITSLHPHRALSKIHIEGCSQPHWDQSSPLEFLWLWRRVVECRVCGHTCTARQRSRKREVATPRPYAIGSAALGMLSCLPVTSS